MTGQRSLGVSRRRLRAVRESLPDLILPPPACQDRIFKKN